MADDLSNVASLLKDTNKKLDKLHSDNEQNDTKGDIIKGSLPEVLNDIYQSQRQIDQWKKEADRDKATDDLIKDKEEKTQKILGDIKKPMTDLGLAIPKSGFNAFSEKASDISAEKTLPSDFKLMVQALSPKALTQGFKVGLGTMFKELGGGIKNIGRGIKSLGSKGLTAAQRKSEEKEKESKENKKDSFLKKMFGKITGFLGGIFSTVSKVAGAGVLALLGAGALYALAKLIESPSWKTVAGVIEYVLNKLDDVFSWANGWGGPLGVLGTALAGWYGAKGILILAGKAVVALGKKLFLKGATDTLAGAAGGATTSITKKGGLLSALGRIAGPATLAIGALYLFAKAMDYIRNRAADKEIKKVKDLAAEAEKKGTTVEKIQENSDEVERLRKLRESKRQDPDGPDARALAEIKIAEEKVAAALKAKIDKEPPPSAAVFGGTPKQISENLAKIFKRSTDATAFRGTGKERVGQLDDLFSGVSKRLLSSKAFQDLDKINKQRFLGILKSSEQKAFSNIASGGTSKLRGRAATDSSIRSGLSTKEMTVLMEGIRDQRKQAFELRKEQIKDPTIIKLNDELRNNTEELKKMNDAKKSGKGDTIIAGNSSKGGDRVSLTVPVVPPLVIGPVTGQNAMYIRN
jgi:hypothetical protein